MYVFLFKIQLTTWVTEYEIYQRTQLHLLP